jgi:hypothetical protein
MMHVEKIQEGHTDAAAERMADLFGPAQVDQTVRQALQFCWMALPKDRKDVEELERQFRRIVERALKDFHEDSEAFGGSKQRRTGHSSRRRPRAER